MESGYKGEIVRKYILDQIKEGKYETGKRLPSCRDIAAKLSVNKITVNKAFHQLEKEHIVFGIPKGGFYLVDDSNRLSECEYLMDLSIIRPDEKLIPYREFEHVINKAADMYKYNLLNYDESSGCLSLKETLRAQFMQEGVYTDKGEIIVTNGAQQAILLALMTIYDNHDKSKLLVESPTYNLILELVKQLNIEILWIERNKEGYDYKMLEELFKNEDIKAFYIMPRHHNPTGYTLSESDKQRISILSQKYSVTIIEDDYLGDLGSVKGFMPLHYYDINKNTIYIRSFSKVFMPGIRVGAAVVPNRLAVKYKNIKYLSDLNTSKLTQSALDIFIKSGMYEKHLAKVKKAYDIKLKRVVDIFCRLNPSGFEWNIPEHGIYVWLKFNKNIDGNNIEAKLKRHGIVVKMADEFFPDSNINDNYKKGGEKYMRLCISSVSLKQIDRIATVIAVLEDSLSIKMLK